MEENFPTVNIEAIACGLPVITYNTGGSPEIIDETCGKVIDKGNIDKLYEGIMDIYNHPFERDACLKRSRLYNMNDKFAEYVELYKEILGL